MKLPNPDQAVIDMQKLTNYCLNPEHADGQHKAYVFQAALGIRLENAIELRDALLQAVKNDDAVPGKLNQHGQKYVIDFSMTRFEKLAVVRSAWIVRYDENFPRLVTCYIL
ncbi:MAG: hypothetical protein KME42_02970 [Tildeniella nuda ZEHNDER 1965/U140]|jgi:hypothetical protein|nr:hypothetical protein [Tildeniella nuda ZEHNDER 1965/U140]